MKALGYRESRHEIFEVLKVIFKTRDIRNSIGIMNNTDKDPDEVFWWLEQNITTEYEDPGEVARAFDYLSAADLFRSRVAVMQNWRFKKYMIDVMCGGVSISKKEMYRKFSPYRPPQRMLMYGATKVQRKDMKEICRKIGEKIHVSSGIVMKEYVPVLKIILKNREWRENVEREMELEEDELKLLA